MHHTQPATQAALEAARVKLRSPFASPLEERAHPALQAHADQPPRPSRAARRGDEALHRGDAAAGDGPVRACLRRGRGNLLPPPPRLHCVLSTPQVLLAGVNDHLALGLPPSPLSTGPSPDPSLRRPLGARQGARLLPRGRRPRLPAARQPAAVQRAERQAALLGALRRRVQGLQGGAGCSAALRQDPVDQGRGQDGRLRPAGQPQPPPRAATAAARVRGGGGRRGEGCHRPASAEQRRRGSVRAARYSGVVRLESILLYSSSTVLLRVGCQLDGVHMQAILEHWRCAHACGWHLERLG